MDKEITSTRGRPVGTRARESDAVRQVRQSLGWTQEQLARDLNCSLSAVRTMEREGRLPGQGTLLDAFKRLAERARVSLEEEKAEQI